MDEKNKMDYNKWYIIVNDFDLNIRIGEHKEPKLLKQDFIEFNTKDELIKVYEKMINKYMKKSYDWHGHSEGAMKFYYGHDKIETMTTLLVYHNNNEVMEGLFN